MPNALVATVSVMLYNDLGVSNEATAFFTSLLYLPWVIKPLWSPAVDLLKTRRQWIWTMQLLLGLGLAGIQEAKDTSLKNLKDVRAYTNLPVLCSIPLLENTMLVKRKKRLAYLAWTAAVIVGAIAVSAALFYHVQYTA